MADSASKRTTGKRAGNFFRNFIHISFLALSCPRQKFYTADYLFFRCGNLENIG
jgi:hypothetical protein